jgi:hypothetical protein
MSGAGGARVSYAPPVSGAELRSARVGVSLGRPVNAAVGAFFFRTIFLSFFFLVLLVISGFSFPFLFCVLFLS